jgi:hypothetical protein
VTTKAMTTSLEFLFLKKKLQGVGNNKCEEDEGNESVFQLL